MPYSLDSLESDCYENTNVLINKFHIKDEKALDNLEQTITSALIAKALVDISFVNVDFSFYKMLHKYVFSDLYEWAGKVRSVNMSKQTTNFCPCDVIEDTGEKIFERLKQQEYFKNFNDKDFIEEFTSLYCSLNYLHAFREGNGRIQRLFMSMLLNYLGYSLDLSLIDRDLLMIATIKAANGDVCMLEDIFRENIKFN